jgi:hypothetical protein
VSPRAKRWLGKLAPLALYLSLACASTWPLLSSLRTHVPSGSEPVATVPLVSAWALWWTSDRAAVGFADYWQAPIFYPTRDAFALSEAMPLAGLLTAPLLWCGLPLALAYNIFLLAALTLNGLCSQQLLRRQRVHPAAALFGGAIVTLLPGVHHQLGVLTLVPMFGVLLTLSSSLALLRTPTWPRGLWLGLSFTCCYLLCAQYALLLALCVGPALLSVLGRRLFVRARLLALLLAAAVACLTLAPVVLAQRQAAAMHRLARSPERAVRGAATPASYWRSPPAPLLRPFGVQVDQRSGTALFPGLLKLGLAVLGLSLALRRPARARSATLLALVLALAMLLSVSPRLGSGAHNVHGALAAVVPGLVQVRSIWRAGLLAQLVLALLAAYGMHTLLLRVRTPGARVALAVLALLAAIEVWPRPRALAPLPDRAAYEPFATFLRTHLAPGEAYLFLPLPTHPQVRAFEDTARMMVLTAAHGHPMLNGYSSFFPAPYEALWRASPRVGDPRTESLLRTYGVRFVVVRKHLVDLQQAARWRMRFVSDPTDLVIYQLPDPR